MEDRPKDEAHGLPWPEDYGELRPLIERDWGASEIYLLHKLSGKSGAQVYTTDISCADFSGQAILKFDAVPEQDWQERSEVERHRDAIETAPDFAAAHLPRIVHSLSDGKQVAILSTIAGRGLEYAKPWAECAHDVQLEVVRTLSRDLLEAWNGTYEVERGLVSPRDVLRGWLGYRLDPEAGRLHSFLADTCGVPAEMPTVMFEGIWYPNPLAFAVIAHEAVDRCHQRSVKGNVHGDLHGFNVLVGRSREPWYYLIDLAYYDGRQYLFYDHAYFELSHLLMMRERADAANWRALLNRLGTYTHSGDEDDLRGDDLGLLEITGAIRREVAEWIDRHEANRLAYLEGQYLLARVAVGLNFANKAIPDKSRRMAFLYAAANLKDFLKLNDLAWNRHGPPLDLDGPSVAAPVTGTATAPRTLPGEADPAPDHPPFPDRPAIAVLALDNLSGDPSRDYVVDGITQQIIDALSQIDWLMVISRGATFAYKGRSVDIKQIGRELGVHYVVEGSVRMSGDRVRISVQLINALNSYHLWSERYDRDVSDLFALEEEIADTIAANVDSTLKVAERKSARSLTGRITTWLSYQHALWQFFNGGDAGERAAREELVRITETEPEFADAHAVLSIFDTRRVLMFATDDPQPILDVARGLATRAVSLDDVTSMPRIALSRVLMLEGKHDGAIEQARMAVGGNPSSSAAHLHLALALCWAGQAAEALTLIEKSLRLSPLGPFRSIKRGAKGFCQYFNGDLEQAEAELPAVTREHFFGPAGLLTLAATYARRGRSREAGNAIQELFQSRPDVNRTRLRICWNNLAEPYLGTFLSDLETAGLAE